ncbi:protein-tyrosine phosphatase [Mobilisporobacter senegalensis]|uniref:protein-tyrosine-phosphatase n=2 Tax=Mobilisporobacter senegalensis TaxID=1329262 RepID=A0A3N1XRF7_9FIRM|nr:protein-tyrosine phosphatase [Mobilisporobacter senegalensis]
MVIAMIDIHTHILPYIDDGAKDLTEAIKMTECLYLQQVTSAVCSPHFDPTRNTLEEFLNMRTKSFHLLKDSKIKLYVGSETMFHDFLFQYPDLSQLCINNTKYLLLEFPYDKHWEDHDFNMIEKLMGYYNIIPIIAHIERYRPLWNHKKQIKKLIDLGCVIQINTNTIIEKKNRRKALHYIKKDLIDVLGSDCHNMTYRPPIYTVAFDIIEQKLGKNYCSELQHKAECVIKGTEVRNRIGHRGF